MIRESLAGLLLVPCLALAEGEICPSHAPGDPSHWRLAVCGARSGTDDFESASVQSCVRDLASRDTVDRRTKCARNLRYKHEWCEFLLKLGNSPFPSEGECLRSEQSVPGVVRSGGIGGK